MSVEEDSLKAVQHAQCRRRLERAVASNRTVQKMVDAIEGLGCKIPTDFLACRQCPASISGGFVVHEGEGQTRQEYKPRIILCENVQLEKETFEHTLIHELVHAYDQCRAKIDWKNCLHHACTEVRASAMSGECNLLHELFRGNTTVRNGHQECVRRRAEKSVAMNPYCKDVARDAVDVVFKECLADQCPLASE